MTPKIYVFCNQCDHEWHVMIAIAEDGTFLASHVCSHHGFAAHDMGINKDGWKRDKYAEHYPDGFEVEWIESPKLGEHPGLDEAWRLNQERAAIAEGRP